MKISSYIIVCIVVTAVLFALIIATAINIKKNNAKYLLFALIVAFISSFSLTMSLGLIDTDAKIFWDNVKFIGVVFLPLALLLIYSSVIKLKKLLSKKIIILLCILPVISLILVFTNNFHHLFTTRYDFLENNGTIFVFQTRAVWYYIHTAYSYIFTVLAFFMLVYYHLKKPKIYRTQTLILIVAASAGICVSMLSTLRVFTDYGDATILAYSVGMWLQYWGLILFKPIKMIKTAKDIAYNNLQDPVLIFDNNNSFLDANICAVSRFSLEKSKIKDVDDFFVSKLKLDPKKTETLDDAEICVYGKEPMYFNVDDRMLFDVEKRYSGRVLLLNDITKIKSLANELEFTASRDVLTGLYNRRSFRENLKKLDKICPVSIISLITNNTKFYRNIIGNEYCENTIKALANIITDVCGKHNYCARISDEEFVILLQAEHNAATEMISIIQQQVSKLTESDLYLNISYGISTKNYKNENIEIVCKTATESMYNDQLINALTSSGRAISSLKKLLYKKTYETEDHIERTIAQCTSIAQSYGITSGLENLTKLAIAHDIGMDESDITNKKEPPQNQRSSHVIKGYDIAQSLTELSMIAHLILAHHEKYDGTGYPKGLKGEDIPLFARIVALVDYYDKLVYGYKSNAPTSREEALSQIKQMSGTTFDPIIAEML